MPACEATGDREPEGDLRAPTEIAWFRLRAEELGCRWQQVAFGPSFGAALADTGDIFFWGSCPRRGESRRFLEPRPLLFEGAAPGLRFRDVQCSEKSIWALATTGEVVVWERAPAILAELASAPASQMPRVARGGKLVAGMDRPVRILSVGASHASFITDEGDLYCLGSNRCGECGMDPAKEAAAAGCRLVHFPRHCNPIARVSCGRTHTVAIGAEGQVLSWGDDSKIQLGLGDTRSNVGEERPWEGSRGLIRKMQTGESMATTSALRGGPDAPSSMRGGSTSGKKYGEFDPHHQWRPSMMMDIPLEFERQAHGTPYPPPDGVVCGDDTSILIVRDSPDWFSPEEETNRLFCCGDNERGQCGRSTQQQQQTLAAVRLPRHSYTSSVSCGSSHCVALVTRSGSRKREIWAWGCNDRGQAGETRAGVVCPAARQRLPKEADARVEAVHCGFSSSAAVCSDRPSRAPAGAEPGAARGAEPSTAGGAGPGPAGAEPSTAE